MPQIVGLEEVRVAGVRPDLVAHERMVRRPTAGREPLRAETPFWPSAGDRARQSTVGGASMSTMSDLISDEELVATFAHLGIDRDSADHFRGRLEHRLLLNRCDDCGRWHQPPRADLPGLLVD